MLGINALTITDGGSRVIPQTREDWTDWVSATATRNHALEDPLLDWLDLYGNQHGFTSDFHLPGYDPRTDFSRFLMQKGRSFESAVINHLKTTIPIQTIATSPMQSRSLEAAEQTLEAMCRGELAISQAVLRDPESRTYGLADLLVRSDELRKLFPGSLTEEESSVPAPDLGSSEWHYRVVDIKFTTLELYPNGELTDSGGSSWAYRVQLYIYNRALGRLQGFLPPQAFLLGRGWKQKATSKGSVRGTNCLARLGALPQEYTSMSKGSVHSAASASVSWMRRLRHEGADWHVLPEPSVPELRPNMSRISDQPWHNAKHQIGSDLEDLTMLWQVGHKGRAKAHKAKVLRWSDPACIPSTVGVTGTKRALTLNSILRINQSREGHLVLPEKVTVPRSEWRVESPLEFFVDFETLSDLDDDFSAIPEKGGLPLIFMIGCGHIEDGKWLWSEFTVDSLTEPCEAAVIDAWFNHMEDIRRRIDPHGNDPLVFHWSHAEQSTLDTAFNSARKRHSSKRWPHPRWYDFLELVVREAPVVIRGTFGFGLKSIAGAMYHHGLISTQWPPGPSDGLSSMIGAWWSASQARKLNCPLREIQLIQQIQRYNEADCKVMMEIIKYIRKHH